MIEKIRIVVVIGAFQVVILMVRDIRVVILIGEDNEQVACGGEEGDNDQDQG